MIDSLFNTTIYCNEKGYEFLRVDAPGGYRFNLLHKDKLIKKGGNIYSSWIEGEKEVYNKLYKILAK